MAKEIFSHPNFQEKLVLKYGKKENPEKKEVFGSLENGLWWKQKEASFHDFISPPKYKTKNNSNKNKAQVPAGAVVMPIILYSDETQALNYGSKTFYPLYMTIGNLPKDLRRKMAAYRLVAYLPVLEGTKKEKRQMAAVNLKGQVLHKCLARVMESIIEPGKSGVSIPDAKGNVHRVFPYFCYYTADWPEGKKVTLLKDGKATAKPCHGCDVPRDDLDKISNATREHTFRTHSEMKQHLSRYKDLQGKKGKKKEAQELLRVESFHPYEVSKHSQFLFITPVQPFPGSKTEFLLGPPGDQRVSADGSRSHPPVLPWPGKNVSPSVH